MAISSEGISQHLYRYQKIPFESFPYTAVSELQGFSRPGYTLRYSFSPDKKELPALIRHSFPEVFQDEEDDRDIYTDTDDEVLMDISVYTQKIKELDIEARKALNDGYKETGSDTAELVPEKSSRELLDLEKLTEEQTEITGEQKN